MAVIAQNKNNRSQVQYYDQIDIDQTLNTSSNFQALRILNKFVHDSIP